jgi:tryptophan synthase alpha chain
VSRIGTAFAASRGRTGLIPYITAGYPSLDASLDMMRALDGAGALAIEIGIPFSDPIADGPDIQRASEWALRQHVGVPHVLDLVARFRRESELPLVLMTYFNPILRAGVEAFAAGARAAGVDGVLVSDLPPEETPEVWECFDLAGIDTVVLVAPTTDSRRLPRLVGRSRGFVYCLARTGVTGSSDGYSGPLPDRVAELRRHSTLPVAVGFGISGAGDARAMREVADAIVVGAAFMREVGRDLERGADTRVRALADQLVAALR